jgi:hypothetical protein
MQVWWEILLVPVTVGKCYEPARLTLVDSCAAKAQWVLPIIAF